MAELKKVQTSVLEITYEENGSLFDNTMKHPKASQKEIAEACGMCQGK